MLFQGLFKARANQINLAITALENVATIYKDSVGTSLCMHFSCLCCWRQLQNQGTRNEGTGRRKICTCKQRILQRGVKPLFGVVFRDFHCYKNNRNSQAVRVLILRTRQIANRPIQAKNCSATLNGRPGLRFANR